MDASALVKLVRTEPESEAAQRSLGAASAIVSSIVVAAELLLAARKTGDGAALERAEVLLEAVELIRLDLAIARRAAEQTAVRALDAIHIATAVSLGEAITCVVTYDRRMIATARAAGLAVHAPSA